METLLIAIAASFSFAVLVLQLFWRVKLAMVSQEVVIKISGDPDNHYSKDLSGNLYTLDDVKISDIRKPSDAEIREVATWLAAAAGDAAATSKVGRRKARKAVL